MKGYYTGSGYMGYVLGTGYQLSETEGAYYEWEREAHPELYIYESKEAEI